MANTQNQNYPLPAAGELLSDDINKLIAAFNAIDVDISQMVAGLEGKATTGHNHTIADITSLQDALNGLASADHAHPLNDLTDVDTSAAALGYIIVLTANGWVAQSPVAALGEHQHTIAQVTNLTDALGAKLAKADNLAGLTDVSAARANLKMLTMTQAAYDALGAPDAETLYILEE